MSNCCVDSVPHPDRGCEAFGKMLVSEASAVIERLTGVKLPSAPLDREARRQGQQAMSNAP